MRSKNLWFALALLLSISVLAAFAAPDAEPTYDRAYLLKYLDENHQEFLKAVEGLSDEQWRYKPAADRWSIAEVAEHLTKTEKMLGEMVRDQIMKSEPAAAERIAAVKGKEAVVLKDLPKRSQKVQAPEPLHPTNEWPDRGQLLKEFKARREANLEFIRATDEAELRRHLSESAFGDIDAYQWMLYIGAHVERHLGQVAEVKQSAGYPKQ